MGQLRCRLQPSPLRLMLERTPVEENMAKLHFMRVTPAQPAKHAPRCRSADRVGRVS